VRKVFGIGETILDIIFRDDRPQAAVPGGSSFNAIISLGRAGIDTTFISETGDDRVGRTIIDFMRHNGVDPAYMTVPEGSKSPISLAFLNEKNDAEYIFYKDHPHDQLQFEYPQVTADDIVLFGSFYAVNPVIRQQVGGFLRYAHEQGALLYYDVNFRRPHLAEAPALMPIFDENFTLSNVVRGSTEDFGLLFGIPNPEQVYRQKLRPRCPQFICTDGSGDILVFSPGGTCRFPVKTIPTVSTIGAGDNFNAGFIYGLISQGVRRADLPALSASDWAGLIASGQRFSVNVCQSVDNYIDQKLGDTLKEENKR
jgi:fructokinase